MKFLYLALVVIIFFGSFLLGFQVRAKELGIKLYDIGEARSLPVLSSNSTFPVLSAQGVIAIDVSSNVTLYEKNADLKLYPASTTKIITALVGLDYYRWDQVLTVGNPSVEGQRLGLVMGEEMTFENLLEALLIYSANDAAMTIADNYPGGRAGFVAAMNTKAQSLHLENSYFVNPAGLDDAAQITTARDMVRVAKVAMQNPIFVKIVGTKYKKISDASGKFLYELKSINQLLGSVDGVFGIKTGWTEGARENLVTSIDRNGHVVLIALLGSQDRFGETKELIEWIYENYSWQEVTFTQRAVGMILK